MGEIVTVAGEIVGGPEYEEAATGKVAWFDISVVRKRRVDDEWVSDPPVVYRVVVSDGEGLGLVPSLDHGTRVLVSGTLDTGSQPPVMRAADIARAYM